MNRSYRRRPTSRQMTLIGAGRPASIRSASVGLAASSISPMAMNRCFGRELAECDLPDVVPLGLGDVGGDQRHDVALLLGEVLGQPVDHGVERRGE